MSFRNPPLPPTVAAQAAGTLIGGGLLLVAMAGLAAWGGLASDRAARLVAHANEVIRVAQGAEREMLLAQVNHRSFLLTSDPTALAALHSAEDAVDTSVSRLLELTRDNTTQQGQLHELGGRVRALRAFRERVIAARGHDLQAALALFSSPEGNATRGAVADLIAAVIRTEDDLLLARAEGQRRATRLLHLVVIAALTAVGGLFARGMWVVRRHATELAASEDRWRALSESSPEGVLVHRGGIIVYLNRSAARMIQLTPEQVVGRPFIDTIHPDHRAAVSARMEALGEQDGPLPPRVVGVLRADGGMGEVEATSAAIQYGGQRAIQIVLRDVTERRRAEVALQASEARYRLLAENAADLISRRSLDGVFEYASPSHETVLGWKPEELLGRSGLEFMHPDDVERVRLGPVARSTAGEGPAPFTLRVRHKEGRYVWLEVILRPIVSPDGAVTGHIVSARDVTERMALEEQLRQSQKLEAMGRMASAVAHDFNNLLMVIRASVDLAGTDLARNGSPAEDVANITNAVDRASALTAQLLAFSQRQHHERIVMEPARRLREQRALWARVAAPTAHVDLEVAPDADRAAVSADPAQFDHVVLTLVANARDALVAGGAIGIRVATRRVAEPSPHRFGTLPAGEYVTLAIEDSGAGIEPAVLERLFEPFFTTKPQGQGTGLGLATVHGIVEQAGGSVTVETAASRGTTFTVYWPRVQGPAVGAGGVGLAGTDDRPPLADRLESRRQADTILLVEDEEALRRALGRVIQRLGYAVVVAGSGTEALEAMAREGPRVRAIVTDVRMPGMSGVELVTRLMSRGVDLPVLFISGQLDAALPTDWPPTAPRGFLSKPFTFDQLSEELRRILGAAVAG